MLRLTVTEQAELTLVLNGRALDGVPDWWTSDGLIAAVEPIGDGLHAIVRGIATGTALVTVIADAALDEGPRQIVGTMDVQIVSPDAVSLPLVAGPVTPQT